MQTTANLILASASAARRNLLRQAGLNFQVQGSGVDEDAIKTRATGPHDALAADLAFAKAQAVSAQNPGALVIGADQILVCNGARFDKPTDRAQAAAHLRLLRGQQHELVTAACLLQDGEPLWHQIAIPKLTMRNFSDAFIEAYLAAEGDEILACVGAYRLEGPGIQLFAQIDGDFFTILGLPLLPLLAFLRSSGALAA